MNKEPAFLKRQSRLWLQSLAGNLAPSCLVGLIGFVQKTILYTCMYTYIIGDSFMVRVISISDEVYSDLSRMKNGKSFTELLKTLISECNNKGDAKRILEFLNANEPLSEEGAKAMLEASEKGRKSATTRKSASFE